MKTWVQSREWKMQKIRVESRERKKEKNTKKISNDQRISDVSNGEVWELHNLGNSLNKMKQNYPKYDSVSKTDLFSGKL